MIDRILAARAKDIFVEQYEAEQSITDRELLNPESKDLTVIFPPWHGGGGFIHKFSNNLASEGSAVLSYKFHDQILEPNLHRVPESFDYIQGQITHEIEQLQIKWNYQRIRLVGFSLGNVALALVAKKYPDFQEAHMVVAGDNLATLMWDGTRTRDIRKQLEDKGHSREEVDAAWRSIAPSEQSEALGEKMWILSSRSMTEFYPRKVN